MTVGLTVEQATQAVRSWLIATSGVPATRVRLMDSGAVVLREPGIELRLDSELADQRPVLTGATNAQGEPLDEVACRTVCSWSVACIGPGAEAVARRLHLRWRSSGGTTEDLRAAGVAPFAAPSLRVLTALDRTAMLPRADVDLQGSILALDAPADLPPLGYTEAVDVVTEAARGGTLVASASGTVPLT